MTDAMFSLSVDGIADPLSVVQVDGKEAMSKLFRLEVTVVVHGSDQASFLKRVQRRDVVLEIRGGRESGRTFVGIVAKAKSLAYDPQKSEHWYRLRIRPALWLLSKRIDNRIFQNVSTEHIVSEVLAGAGVPYEWRLRRTSRPRDYCVQYQESDLAFVRRLLAEDGTAFFFEDDGRIVLIDEATYRPISGNPVLPFRPAAGMVHGEALQSFNLTREVSSTSAIVKHFDYHRPALRIRARRG